PLWATLKAIAVAIAAALICGRLFGASGIAAAIALGAWSNAFSLMRRGAATFGFSVDTEARRRLPRIALAALAMGSLLWAMTRFALAQNTNGHGFAHALILFILIAGGIAVYGLLLSLFGVTGWREALDAVRRTPPGD